MGGPRVAGTEAPPKDQKGGACRESGAPKVARASRAGRWQSLPETKGIYRYRSLGPKLGRGRAVVCEEEQAEQGEQSPASGRQGTGDSDQN